MPRYIDAEKLKSHYSWWDSEHVSDELKERKTDFDTIIDLQPTADVAPVAHAKWMQGKDGFSSCSACEKYWVRTRAAYYHWYCPHCGAKMDEE